MPLGELARVMRGIATGANDFFFVTAEQAKTAGLPDELLLRAVGRTRDAAGDELRPEDLADLERRGRPTFLLALDGRPRASWPARVRRYLDRAEGEGLARRPLIASRRPWYKMETRTPPPLLFAYLGRRKSRFIRNRAGVVPLTAFLCVYPRVDADALWRALRSPLSEANLARVGKSYGSGAIKVEPRALERLVVPYEALESAGVTLPPRRQAALFAS